MGVGDRIENSGQEAKGNVKQGLGEATDNDRLKNEGRADEAKGKVKNAVEFISKYEEIVARAAGGALDGARVAAAEEHRVDEQREQLVHAEPVLPAFGERMCLVVGLHHPRQVGQARWPAQRSR